MELVTITTKNGLISGRAAGELENPLLLGLHGWSRRNGWHTWEPLMAPLAAAGYRVVSIDMPGWGESQAWGQTLDAAAIGALLDGLGTRSAGLLGKSWGGGLGLGFALVHPERVSALILTAPAYSGGAAELGRLKTPVLLAWAEDDPMIPIAHGEAMAAAIPVCTFVRYPQGGHSAAMKNAADFAPRAVSFLKQIASPT